MALLAPSERQHIHSFEQLAQESEGGVAVGPRSKEVPTKARKEQ